MNRQPIKIKQIPTYNQQTSQQIINEAPNIQMLKKMFVKTKNKNQHLPNEQSLLFNRHSSLAILKAYRKRKKIVIKQSVLNKQSFLDDSKFLQKNISNSTIDSPQKQNLNIEAKKYQHQSSFDKELYDSIIRKIEQQNMVSRKLPQINKMPETNKLSQINNSPKMKQKQQFIPKFSKKSTIDMKQNSTNKTIQSNSNTIRFNKNEDQIDNKLTLPSLLDPQVKPQTDIIDVNVHAYNAKINSKNIEPALDKYQIFQIKRGNALSNGTIQDNKILMIKSSLRNSVDNPNNYDKKKNNISSLAYGTVSQCKLGIMGKPQGPDKESILPQLSKIKSVKSLASQQCNRPKGYMNFHIQGKKFIKQNRQKLNQQQKIKSFLISGITATSYAVVDTQTLTIIAGKNLRKKIQIASISKIMTCYLCLLACKKYSIDMKQYKVRISESSVQMQGTSAQLQVGDCLSIEQLLYGLMLPSGNDASVAIAEVIGKIIQKYKIKQTKKTYYQTFIAHMNMLARQLKLDQQWKNSSGLPKDPNHSTPEAISILAVVAMMEPKFKQIVCCKQYQVTIKNQRFGLKRKMIWKNTNKLLDDGWQGVKTGTTQPAGHCLMAKKGRYLISVYDSKTLSKRFTQCSQLYDFVKSKQRYLFPQKWD